jgi:2-iminobutanoate/2-iminopropanoate deaminase
MAERRWTPHFLPADVPLPVGAYSPAIRAGDFVYVSGQVPRDPRTGALVGTTVETQAAQVLANIREALHAAGASLDHVVNATVYLANDDDWSAMNDFWRTAFTPPYPTRTTVGAGLRGILVEVSVIAYVPS